MATISKTLEITSEGVYSLSFSVAPNGSTVTPVNDIQTWLHCANIWDKDYTTLDEVLADTTTLLALISSNNAVDYMVRSHDWCENPGLVPVMTSNTTPSGVASASTTFNDPANYPYRAFSGVTTSSYLWCASSNSAGQWLQYEFPTATLVGLGKIILRVTNSKKGNEYHFIVKASNDGFTTESTVSERITIPASSENIRPQLSFNINTNGISYKQYRIVFEESIFTDGSNFAGVSNLQYYTYAYSVAIPEDETAMTYIGANDYAADTLLADDNPGLVPAMTSNTTPSGECVGDNLYGSDYWKVFNSDNSLFCQGNTGNITTTYIGYDFGYNTHVTKITVLGTCYNSAYYYKFKLQGFDGTNWEDITGEILTVQGSYGNIQTYNISIPTYVGDYSKYRLSGTSTNTSGGAVYIENVSQLYLYTVQFYAKDGSWLESICNSTYFESVLNVKVPTMTSATTPSGVVNASSQFSTGANPPYCAFDNNASTGWVSAANYTNGQWISYQFPQDINVKYIYAKTYIALYQGTVATGLLTVKNISDDVLGMGEISQGICKIFISSNSNTNLYKLEYSNIGNYSYATAETIQMYGRAAAS